MNVDRLYRVVRDVACLAVGLSVIYHQTWVVPPGKASEALLLTSLALIGVPAAGGGLLSRPSGGETGTTTSPSDSPPSGGSPQGSSSSPRPLSGAGGDGL